MGMINKCSGIWEKKVLDENNTLYVCFERKTQLLHNRLDETGYCGETFAVELTDGVIDIFKGAWSSRGEVVREYFPDRNVDWN